MRGSQPDQSVTDNVSSPWLGSGLGGICDSIHSLQCYGDDLEDIGPVTTHDQCCQACEALSGCNAWTWNWEYGGHCYLKSACTDPRTSSTAYHSGIRSSSGSTPVVTFHWSVHWQCGEPNSGGSEACRAAAAQRFGELANSVGAQIATGIELQGASSALSGWSSSGEYEDAVSIMVAPGWDVLRRGGGQIQSGSGARGLAVMLVKPPFTVAGCPQLCVLGVHPGHDPITGGRSIVDSVCGDAAGQCSIAMGDWNVGASGVLGGSYSSWSKLIGGSPSVLAPNSETCCHPSTCCDFDHVGTNIPGATQGSVKVWDYQLTDQFSMDEEHMPVSLHINLPSTVSPAVDYNRVPATLG